LSFGFNKRPLSPIRILGYFSIVAPSRPVTKEGSGSKEIDIVGTFDELLCPSSRVVLILPQQKQAKPIRHTSIGIPTPIAIPYLALLERPVSNIYVI
jgi:hypothetical protein